MQYDSNKYNKLINDVRVYLVNEFKIKLEDRFEPLINELKLDSALIEEIDKINELIMQFPAFKKLQNKYIIVLEENIILKQELETYRKNKKTSRKHRNKSRKY